MVATIATARAALYLRISRDDDGDAKGIQRQREDAYALAAARCWEVANVYEDNDISAFSGVLRPGYEAMIRDAEAGAFDQIICWSTSRLWRNRTQRAREITRLAALRVGVSAVKGPSLDLSTATGRMMADLLGTFDTLESETMSERIQRESLQRAQEGRAHGRLGYGWTRIYEADGRGGMKSRNVIHPDEAAVVVEIVDRLLEQATLRDLMRDLNSRGVPAPRGGLWNGTIIRQIALRPSNAALRVYKGQTMPQPATWPPIVDRDKYDRVVALLTAPERRTARPGKRRHLLSYASFATCGVCGGPLSARMQRLRNGSRNAVYRCDRGSHVARDQGHVDALVGDVVIGRLAKPDAMALLFATDDGKATAARDKADAIRARMDQAADAYAAGGIDIAILKRINDQLKPELEAAQADARAHRPKSLPADVEALAGARAAEVWETLPVTLKRAVIDAIGLRVAILPARRGFAGFDPEAVSISWIH